MLEDVGIEKFCSDKAYIHKFFSAIFVLFKKKDAIMCPAKSAWLSMRISRIEQEKKIVALMIRLYCRRKEKNETLCPACKALLEYAHTRLEHCPFGERKTSCKRCTVHCYKPVMKEHMRQVMRFSGPRMLIYAPGEAIRHWLRK